MTKKVDVCALCKRTEVETTEHHLIPREEGGNHGPTAFLCIPCHKNIHALYTNKELAIRLNSIEALKADEKVWKFVKWIRKQPASTLVKTKRSKNTPSRR
ncbi:HNH endonuclease [Lysinibacillus sp. LZ02]|uniref:HNH endonuclease n=1 Tax=Lysinibacillus sp. LZ02 TaxID=3420668 RepID=UPI003D35A40C